LLTILPFGNHLVKIEISGKVLRQAIEHGVSRIVEDLEDGRFPQISGMEFTFDGRRQAGNRVTLITVGGQPINDSQKYTLSTTAYVLDGGDGYSMFAGNSRILIEPESGAIEAAAVIEAVITDKEIEPQITKRSRRLDD
jgi:5'-nucleotidase